MRLSLPLCRPPGRMGRHSPSSSSILSAFLLFLLFVPWTPVVARDRPECLVDDLACKRTRQSCFDECFKYSNYGTGFCAAVSSFLLPTVRTLIEMANVFHPMAPVATDSVFNGGAYFCTSGAFHRVCDPCGVGLEFSDVLRSQNGTLASLSEMQASAALAARRISRDMDRRRRRLDLGLTMAYYQTFQDFDNLDFKFNLISMTSNGTVKNDFAYRHFLASARHSGRESLDGVHHRLKNIFTGNTFSFYYGPKTPSIFELQPEKYCQAAFIDYLSMILLKIREMLFFVTSHTAKSDGQLINRIQEERFKRDQQEINDSVQKACGSSKEGT